MREAVEAGARASSRTSRSAPTTANDPPLEPVWGLLAGGRDSRGDPLRVWPRSVCTPGPEPWVGCCPAIRGCGSCWRTWGCRSTRSFLALAETYPEVRLDTTMAFTDFTEDFTPPSPVGDRGTARRPGGPDSARARHWTSRYIPYPYVHGRTLWSAWSWATRGCGPSATGTAERPVRAEKRHTGRDPVTRLLREFTGRRKRSHRGTLAGLGHDRRRPRPRGATDLLRPDRCPVRQYSWGRPGSPRRAALHGPAVRGLGRAQRRGRAAAVRAARDFRPDAVVDDVQRCPTSRARRPRQDAPGALRRAGAVPDGARLGRGRIAGLTAGRRRLRHQAVQPGGGRGPAAAGRSAGGTAAAARSDSTLVSGTWCWTRTVTRSAGALAVDPSHGHRVRTAAVPDGATRAGRRARRRSWTGVRTTTSAVRPSSSHTRFATRMIDAGGRRRSHLPPGRVRSVPVSRRVQVPGAPAAVDPATRSSCPPVSLIAVVAAVIARRPPSRSRATCTGSWDDQPLPSP